jgi:hypothetical protein
MSAASSGAGGSTATLYTKRTGADRKEIAELMRLTTFLKAEEALRHGFVDRILPALPKPEPTEDACTCVDCPCHGTSPARSVEES